MKTPKSLSNFSLVLDGRPLCELRIFTRASPGEDDRSIYSVDPERHEKVSQVYQTQAGDLIPPQSTMKARQVEGGVQVASQDALELAKRSADFSKGLTVLAFVPRSSLGAEWYAGRAYLLAPQKDNQRAAHTYRAMARWFSSRKARVAICEGRLGRTQGYFALDYGSLDGAAVLTVQKLHFAEDVRSAENFEGLDFPTERISSEELEAVDTLFEAHYAPGGFELESLTDPRRAAVAAYFASLETRAERSRAKPAVDAGSLPWSAEAS